MFPEGYHLMFVISLLKSTPSWEVKAVLSGSTVKAVTFSQKVKACMPMEATFLPMLTEVALLQFRKA